MDEPDPRSAAQRLAELSGVARHDAVVVLGSGWGPAADAFGEPRASGSVGEPPGFTVPVAPGHAGRWASYEVGDRAVLVLFGRTHLYEGLDVGPVAYPVRVAAATGCRTAILTNANGGLRPDWPLGTPVLIRDHLNLTGRSPLVGPEFVDLTDCWSGDLRAMAKKREPDLVEGVYALLPGPHYETPAEAEMLRRLGADVVGMSTVLEAIAARALGLELLGISLVTAVQGDDTAYDPDEVVAVAESTAGRLGPLLFDLLAATTSD